MKTLFAIPVTNGILDLHFGHCKDFALVTVENDRVVNETTVQAPPHEPGKLPLWIKEQGVNKVITGGVGHKAIEIFNANSIQVINGAPALPPITLVTRYLSNTLETDENLCDH